MASPLPKRVPENDPARFHVDPIGVEFQHRFPPAELRASIEALAAQRRREVSLPERRLPRWPTVRVMPRGDGWRRLPAEIAAAAVAGVLLSIFVFFV